MKTARSIHKHNNCFKRGFLCAVALLCFLTASRAGAENDWIEAWDYKIIDANTAYQKWFESLKNTDDSIDVVVVVRVRAFGKRADLVETWNRTWQKQYPDWNWWNKAGCYVTSGKPSDIPEVWLDLRQDQRGNLAFPIHILGHEVSHAIQSIDQRVSNPDSFFKTVFKSHPENSSSKEKIAGAEGK